MSITEYPERNTKLDKYYTGQIYVGYDKWLVMNRVKGSDDINDAIELTLVDNLAQTGTLLGIYAAGRWVSPNPRNSTMLWTILKQFEFPVKRVLDTVAAPMRDLKPFVMEWYCLKRRFRLESIRIKRKLKNLHK